MSHDRILSSAPVNRQAAMQLAKGEEWTPKVKFSDCREECPPLVDPGENSLVGTAWGRLIVVGKTKTSGGKSGRWVCRCKCGSYLTVKRSTVTERKTDRCGRCDYLDTLRAGVLKGQRNDTGPDALAEHRQNRRAGA